VVLSLSLSLSLSLHTLTWLHRAARVMDDWLINAAMFEACTRGCRGVVTQGARLYDAQSKSEEVVALSWQGFLTQR
jgi:hypothetical protein